MADSNIAITEGTGKQVDTEKPAGGDHRQVIILGNKDASASISSVQATDPASDTQGLVVRDTNTSAIAANTANLASTITVKTDPGYTLGSIENINNTVVVKFDPGHTLGNIDTVTRVDRVHNVVDGTMTVADVTAFSARPDINRVFNVVDGTMTVADISTTIAADIGEINSVVSVDATGQGDVPITFDGERPDVQRVHNVVDGTMGIKAGTADIGKIHDLSGTATIPQSISGSTSTAGGSGANTLKSPLGGSNIKVYAFSLTTTAQVQITPRFTTGASGGATELWRTALQAPAQGISGSNMAVTPPGYLFATGTGNTLALYLDSASLVHYSISYFLESA